MVIAHPQRFNMEAEKSPNWSEVESRFPRFQDSGCTKSIRNHCFKTAKVNYSSPFRVSGSDRIGRQGLKANVLHQIRNCMAV